MRGLGAAIALALIAGCAPATLPDAGESTPYVALDDLHANAIAPSCAANEGSCHAHAAYPYLGTASAVLEAVRRPCQLGAQDPSAILDACETVGDRLVIAGASIEIVDVALAADAPFPPTSVVLVLARAPGSLVMTGASIDRLGSNGSPASSRALDGVTATRVDGAPLRITLDLRRADPALRRFLDVREAEIDHVRVSDPNRDGTAHAGTWTEITPGDPDRSFFYQRLVSTRFGAAMPLVPGAWTSVETRAVWCWIRGLPRTGAATSDPIDYAGCPPDPNAPSADVPGAFAPVQAIFASKCATGPCHSTATRESGLDLTPDPASIAANVIGAPAIEVRGGILVAPGQAAASYLLCKVDPACSARAPNTGGMPLGAPPLDADDIQAIADWISAGAPLQ